MKREAIIAKLKRTRAKMDTLQEKQFSLHAWVGARDEKMCPTVCCIAGWYPLWFKGETVLYWTKTGALAAIPHQPECCISEALALEHYISKDLSKLLFIGKEMNGTSNVKTSNGKFLNSQWMDASLRDVKKFWDKIISLIDKGKLDHHLNLTTIETAHGQKFSVHKTAGQ